LRIDLADLIGKIPIFNDYAVVAFGYVSWVTKCRIKGIRTVLPLWRFVHNLGVSAQNVLLLDWFRLLKIIDNGKDESTEKTTCSSSSSSPFIRRFRRFKRFFVLRLRQKAKRP